MMHLSAISQKTEGRLSVRLKAGSNAAYVNDLDNRTSGDYYPADGATSKAQESNSYAGLGVNYDLGDKNLKFSPGLYFTSINLSLYNYDGGGQDRYDSKYYMTYMEIPLVLKYTAPKEITKKLKWYVEVGPKIGLKLKEQLYTKDNYGDYAHFWNMAKQIKYNNDSRAQNGNNKTMALFNPLAFSLLINPGVEYEIADKISLVLGLNIDIGLSNTLNPNLIFKDKFGNTYNNAKLTDLLKVRNNLIGIDLGVRF